MPPKVFNFWGHIVYFVMLGKKLSLKRGVSYTSGGKGAGGGMEYETGAWDFQRNAKQMILPCRELKQNDFTMSQFQGKEPTMS